MNQFGKLVSVSVFGESHGSVMGVTINGLAAGLQLDIEYIKEQLQKRSSNFEFTTPRKEEDSFEIVSGYFNQVTTGAPLTFLVKNNDVRSEDYDSNILRPSHADLVAKEKYTNSNDFRGGGNFSGRLTVLSTIAGAIARSILKNKGIEIYSQVFEVGEVQGESYLYEKPTRDGELSDLVKDRISFAQRDHDSIGGIIETGVYGVPTGIGSPLFGSLEAKLSEAMFSIPGIKGIEFGLGFEFSKTSGSEANDEIYYQNGFKTRTNNSGGINGGISNGMPIIFKTVFRPTPSIGKAQRTVDYKTKEGIVLKGKGRHDAAIFVRGMHVVSNLTAFALLDLIVESEGRSWMI